MLYTLSKLLWIVVVGFLSYNFFLMIVCLVKPKAKDNPGNHEPCKTFACVTPAHNEERVIGPLVRSLRNQKYPKEMYDIYVVADRCSDRTAEIAISEGARVLVRKRGAGNKGYAVQYFLNRLRRINRKYDAVCIFDADNIVHEEFLKKMNDALCHGHKFIQGYLGTKNPNDNWVTKAIHASYMVTNKLFQEAKDKLGLSTNCGGTGVCVTTDILEECGYLANTLTDDLELEVKLALKGIRCVWLPSAVTYDEKPFSVKVAIRQRARWFAGHMRTMAKYISKTTTRGIKEKSAMLLDKSLYLISPLYWFAGGVLTFFVLLHLFFGIHVFSFDLPLVAAITWSILIMFAYPAVGIYLETKDLRNLKFIPYLFAFSYVWLGSIILGTFQLFSNKWYHTPHGLRVKKE